MKIFAHRGLSGFYPENTMLAFKKCLDLDIYGIELDVQKSKDNHLVVIHDETVDRTFKGSGYIKDMTLNELKSLNSSTEIYENNEDCKIPTLREVLTLFKPTPFIINIELKNNKVRYKNLELDVIALVKELKMEKQVIISSFRFKSIKKVSKICPKIKTAYLIEPRSYKLIPKTLLFCNLIKYKCYSINPHCGLVDKNFVKKFHRRDIKVLSYTVNSIEKHDKFSKIHVDGVFTDFSTIFSSLYD